MLDTSNMFSFFVTSFFFCVWLSRNLRKVELHRVAEYFLSPILACLAVARIVVVL